MFHHIFTLRSPSNAEIRKAVGSGHSTPSLGPSLCPSPDPVVPVP